VGCGAVDSKPEDSFESVRHSYQPLPKETARQSGEPGLHRHDVLKRRSSDMIDRQINLARRNGQCHVLDQLA
jgi:hypothetical protein